TTDERSESLARREAEGKLNETIHVDVPKYETPARGILWVQFLPDKKANVVVSDLSPPHDDFPGEVKGWPVPSDKYRRSIVDREVKDAQASLAVYRKGIDDVQSREDGVFEKYWNIDKDVFAQDVEKFDGWGDPAYQEYLLENLSMSAKRMENKIERLREVRP
ncbi:DUF3304 domain-containing protein, partial [Salinicola aestuarinus]|uniref:DUF3304 domain-containing protein n=1 Tax=Salinicola aestuarinus TaxID=1949082 RepID=UPI0013008301